MLRPQHRLSSQNTSNEYHLCYTFSYLFAREKSDGGTAATFISYFFFLRVLCVKKNVLYGWFRKKVNEGNKMGDGTEFVAINVEDQYFIYAKYYLVNLFDLSL